MIKLISWSNGNPGALDFLMRVFTSPEITIDQAAFIEQKLEKYKTLRGTNIYVLYSDLCGKDMDKVILLLKHCPQEILEEACNRQDYSGRKMVVNYLPQK
jgi:hypothetical protein